MDEDNMLCDECAVLCVRLAAVCAHEWRVDAATNTVRGVMRFSEYEMIAAGTETPCLTVASLPDANHILYCRDRSCQTRLLASEDAVGDPVIRPQFALSHL